MVKTRFPLLLLLLFFVGLCVCVCVCDGERPFATSDVRRTVPTSEPCGDTTRSDLSVVYDGENPFSPLICAMVKTRSEL